MREAEFRQAIATRAVALPHPRFGVYRNNVAIGLATALAVRYPMLQRLLGDDECLRLASDFADAGHVPSSPVLVDYGDGFAAFCRSHDIAMRHPFIADLAELESRWWTAYHAAEAAAVAPEQFAEAAAGGEDMRVVFHPSVSLLSASWPVGDIWQDLHAGKAVAAVAPSPQHILVRRPAADVHVEIVSPPRAEFLRTLMAGAGLADAAETAMTRHPGFDPQSEFADLIAAQLIIHLDRAS
jgi:hypothetical protein